MASKRALCWRLSLPRGPMHTDVIKSTETSSTKLALFWMRFTGLSRQAGECHSADHGAEETAASTQGTAHRLATKARRPMVPAGEEMSATTAHLLRLETSSEDAFVG